MMDFFNRRLISSSDAIELIGQCVEDYEIFITN